ncbi:oligosaccharide flippase family protein, partial [candidate division CSSED10-310 bacterium]
SSGHGCEICGQVFFINQHVKLCSLFELLSTMENRFENVPDKHKKSLFGELGLVRIPSDWAALIFPSAAVFLIHVTGYGLLFLLHLVLARTMATSEYGLYVYVLAWSYILSIVAALGMPTSNLRFIPLYLSQGKSDLVRGVSRISRLLSVGNGVILALCVSFFFLAVKKFWLPELGWSILFGIWTIPALAVIEVQRSLLQSIKKVIHAYTPPLLIKPFLLIVTTVLFFHVSQKQALNSSTLFVITLLVLFFIVILQSVLLERCYRPKLLPGPATYETGRWLKTSIPLLFTSFFKILTYQSDLLMVGLILGSTEAGIYNIAAKTANLASFFYLAVAAIAAPKISGYYASGDKKKLRKLMSSVTHIVFWPTFVFSIMLLLGHHTILTLFGEQFLRAKWVLFILIGSQLINAATGLVGYLLDLTGHQLTTLRLRGLCVVLNIILNTIGILLFGIIGAALASMITVSIEKICLLVVSFKKMGINGSLLSLFK